MPGPLSTTRARILLAACLATAAVVAYALIWGPGTPIRTLTGMPLASLVEEAESLGQCLECHEGADMHTCGSCHEGHGEVTLTGVAFDGVLELAGDVPQPGRSSSRRSSPTAAGPTAA